MSILSFKLATMTITATKGFQTIVYLMIFLTKRRDWLTKPLVAWKVVNSSTLGAK